MTQNTPDNAGGSDESSELPLDETVETTFRPDGVHRSTESFSSESFYGKYELGEVLGEGGFGTVHRAAQHEPVRRRVALKILKLGMDSEQVVARFDAERQALARMEHPGIAQVFDAGITKSGRPYFAMEFVDGPPINEYCERNALDLRSRLALFIEVCDAVQHAHQRGIIHRDLKPSNILVTEVDGAPRPKVIDFGISMAMHGDLVDNLVVTLEHQVIGTPGYMSPEQTMGGAASGGTTRADVYALGSVLYELLTGTRPIPIDKASSGGLSAVLEVIRDFEPPRPSTHVEVSTDLDWITLKCLEKEPERRYGSVGELARDIERYLADEPVLASPRTRSYLLRKFVRRHRSAVISAAVFTVVLIVGAVGTLKGYFDARAANATLTSTNEDLDAALLRATEVKRLLKDMLSQVSPEEARDADLRLLRRILDTTASRLTSGEVKDPLVAAELHQLIGDVYLRLSDHENAQLHLTAALDMFREELGRDAEFAQSAARNVAKLWMALGLYEDAESATLECIADRARLHGEDRVWLGLQGQLANIWARTGRFDEAIELFRKTIAGFEANGADTPGALTVRGNYSLLLTQRGRIDEAEPFLIDLIERQRQLNGDDHPDTLESEGALAQLYVLHDRVQDAEPLLLQNLQAKRRVLGDEHMSTISTTSSLASLYEQTDRLADAIELYESNLATVQDRFGREHPNALAEATNLGLMYNDVGQFEKARDLLEFSLEAKRRVVGDTHQWTLFALNGLASAYVGLGRTAEAKPLRIEAMGRYVALADRPDPTPRDLHMAAAVLIEYGDEDEALVDAERAEVYAQRLCALPRQQLGEQLWRYLDTLAETQRLQGKFEAAEATLERALEEAKYPEDKAWIQERLQFLEESRGIQIQ